MRAASGCPYFILVTVSAHAVPAAIHFCSHLAPYFSRKNVCAFAQEIGRKVQFLGSVSVCLVSQWPSPQTQLQPRPLRSMVSHGAQDNC